MFKFFENSSSHSTDVNLFFLLICFNALQLCFRAVFSHIVRLFSARTLAQALIMIVTVWLKKLNRNKFPSVYGAFYLYETYHS